MKKYNKRIFTALSLLVFVLNISFVFAKEVITENNIDKAKSISANTVAQVLELKKKHPNWKFEFVNTNYAFEDAVKLQFGEGRGLVNGLSPINLIESYGGKRYGKPYIDPARAHLAFDANQDSLRWQAPSIEAVRYYLDPRTYITEENIFTFLTLQGNNDKFDEGKTKEMIRRVLQGTKNESRTDIVYEVAKRVDVDVLEIATKLRQEGGLEPNRGIEAYNPLNVGATGSDPELKGLEFAKSKGWTTFEKGLEGCAKVVKNNYIARDQDSKYLMKFNVVNNQTYHQYMQNITAALTEGRSLKNAYRTYDSNFEGKYLFKIPLFLNMGNKTLRPSDKDNKFNAIVVTELLYVRNKPSTRNSDRIGQLSQGKEFEVLEKITEGTDGEYEWYRIKYDNKVGFSAMKRINADQLYFEFTKPFGNVPDPAPAPEEPSPKPEEQNPGKPEEQTPNVEPEPEQPKESQNLKKYESVLEQEVTYPVYAVITNQKGINGYDKKEDGSNVVKKLEFDEIVKVLEKSKEENGVYWFKLEIQKENNKKEVFVKVKKEEKEFEFIKKDGLPKKEESTPKPEEQNPSEPKPETPGQGEQPKDPQENNPKPEEGNQTPQKPEVQIPENEKGLNISEKLKNKVVIEEKKVYFGWNINLVEFVKKHSDIEIYNSKDEKVDTTKIFKDTRENKLADIKELEKIFATGSKIVLNTKIQENGKTKEFKEKMNIIRKGDINKDGKVSTADLIKVIRAINKQETLTDEEKEATFVQIKVNSKNVKDMELNIMAASNLTYVILQNIINKNMD